MIFFKKIKNNIANYKCSLLCCLLFTFLITPSSATTPADTADYYSSNYLRYEDFVYLQDIKTPLLHKVGSDMSSPVIELNGTDKLQLSFDDIDPSLKNFYYTFVHCDASWQPSNLNTSDYIDGYTEDRISEYQFSFNTIQKYIHYKLIFPGETTKLTKSGNYIIKVFANFDQTKLVLTRRFMVVDARLGIDATIKPATFPGDRTVRHEINFTINYKNYVIDNPHNDIKVVIRQNGRWDNVISNLKPVFIRDNQLIYTYQEGNLFNGGNEFHILDMRSLRFQAEGIVKFEYDSSKNNNVFLVSDENRRYKRYSSYTDINGRFKIETRDGNNSDIEGDYAFVHFSLPFDAPVTEGNLYVFGGLTDWKADKRFLLQYNYKKFRYELSVYLKQGYYNYEYIYLNDKDNKIDETFIEGNHSETDNDYAIYVYHRGMGVRYDQLIGIKQLNSLQGY